MPHIVRLRLPLAAGALCVAALILSTPRAGGGMIAAGAILPLLCIALGLAVLMLSLRRVTGALDGAAGGRFERIAEGGVPAELLALVRSYNRMVDAIGQRDQDLREELRRTALLTRLSIELRETDDVIAIVHGVLAAIAADTHAQCASLILLAPDGSVAAAEGISEGRMRAIAAERVRRVLERGLAGWALRHGRSVATPDRSRDERWVWFGAPAEGGAMAIPLTYGRDTLGVLTVVNDSDVAFTGKDLLLLEGAASQAAVAISAVQRQADERQSRDQALMLFSMSQFLTAPRSSCDLAVELLEKSAAAFHASAAALYLADHRADTLELFVSRGPASEGFSAECQARVAAVAERAWRGREAITEELHPVDRPAGERCFCVALPLHHAGQSTGAFVLLHRAAGPAVLSARAWSLLTIFTNVAAAAFANLQLIDKLRLRNEELEVEVGERTQQLQHSRDLLRIIFDGLPDGLVLLDNSGAILTANAALARSVLGRRTDEIVGRRYPEVLEELERTDYLSVKQETSSGTATRMRRSDLAGQVRWYDVDRYAIQAPGGTAQTIERWRDVTRELGLQQSLLVHDQLATLGRLAASVVHEVGNPLQSIRSCVDLCREDGAISADSAEYLELAATELERLSLLMSRLRDLYHAPREPWRLVQLNELALVVRDVTSRQLMRDGLTLELDLDPSLPPAHGQTGALRQILLNLVLNAPGTRSRRGSIRLATRYNPAHGAIRVSVEDAGRGMSREQLAYIFEPPQPGRSTLHGAGLYMSKLLIEQHRGTIEIASTPEAGTTIVVTLPAGEAGG
jgi:PAS domain S-box-containing protein